MKKALFIFAIAASVTAASAQDKPAKKKQATKKECCKKEASCCSPSSKANALLKAKPAEKKKG